MSRHVDADALLAALYEADAIDPADSYPAEEWCEEESDNFRTEDGCFRFERRREDEQE